MEKNISPSRFPLKSDFKGFIKIMKTCLLFLFAFTFHIMAFNSNAQDAIIELKANTITVSQLITEIEKQTDYFVVYSNREVDTSRTVYLKNRSNKVSEYLNQAFSDTDIGYDFEKNYIVLSKKAEKPISITTNLVRTTQQQGKTVRGSVTDVNGDPVIGVTIVVKDNPSQGTVTDMDGNFILSNLPENAVLQITYVGMKQQEILVENKTIIDVVMIEETIGLEEVVAIGYGTQKRVTLTGAIATTRGDEILKSKSPNVLNSLVGKLPGVIINTISGEPGRDNPSFLIRGRNTTGNSNPLIIVDGVQRDDLGLINPSDIEDITVLKDATAAIYGARSANGVVLVTTKRGKESVPIFNFSYNQGFSQPTRNIKMADAYTFAKVYNETEIAEGRDPRYTNEELNKFREGTDPNYPNTDWFSFITKKFTPQHRTNLSASGVTKGLSYYFSIGELTQNGHFNFGITKVKQYNLRTNVEVQVTDFFKVGLNVSGRLNNNEYPSGDTNDFYSHIYLYPPTESPYWPGTKYLKPLRDSENIINRVSGNSGYNNQKNKKIETTLNYSLYIPWVKGLSVEGSANWDGSFNFQKVFNLPTYVYYKDSSTGELFEARSGRQSNQATLGETFSQFTRFTINTRINYEQSFGNHNINFLLGAEQMEENYNFLYGYRSNFPSTALSVIDAGSNDKNHQSNSGNATQFSRLNYFGRMTYDYKSKYLAQLILRYDGSPNFPETKRWGAFPGISVGWRISEEPFLNDLYFLDNLKLRASYGKMGNDNVAAFQYLMTYSYGNNYVLDNKDVTGLIQSGTPNPNITWEVAETSNIGFESLMWQGLLNIELDLFKTKRSNILTKRSAIVPSYTGLVLPDENIGIVENKGIELQLSHMNSINEFKYSINGNFSFARNKVVFSDEAPAAEDYQLATGRPIGSSLYYKSLGIFSSQNEIDSYPHLPGTRPGDIKYEDVNKDGEINSRDMIRINETNTPEIVYSLNTTFNYRNFDLSVLFQGQANANVYLGSYFTVMSYSLGNFSHIRARDYWSPDNTNATMPRPSLELWNNNTQVSTHYLFNSDFLRLKNLEFGYSLPQKLSQKLGINNLRLYVNGNNILLIYDHFRGTGFDPETNRYWFYPQQRTYNFGIDLTF